MFLYKANTYASLFLKHIYTILSVLLFAEMSSSQKFKKGFIYIFSLLRKSRLCKSNVSLSIEAEKLSKMSSWRVVTLIPFLIYKFEYFQENTLKSHY